MDAFFLTFNAKRSAAYEAEPCQLLLSSLTFLKSPPRSGPAVLWASSLNPVTAHKPNPKSVF